MFSFKKLKLSKSPKKSPKKSRKKSNRYYHVKVTLKLKPQTELNLTDKEFYRHLLKYMDPEIIKETIDDFPLYNIRLLNKTLYFDILKEEGNKNEIKTQIKYTSLADGPWESSVTNFWVILNDDNEELFLVDIDKVTVN
jgi:hypothetical protein